MKTALIYFLVTTAHFVSAGPVNSEDRVYHRFVKFPDSEGNLHNVDLQAPVDQKLVDEVNRNPANNLYLLYTRRNPINPQTLVLYNAASITTSNFNPRVPTVVIVHGWLGNQNSDINPVVRDAHFVSAGPVDTEDRVKQRFIKFPDSEGNLHDVDLQAPVDQKLIDKVNRNPVNNLYLLYTRRNPVNPQILVLYNATSITNSNFNPRVPTVVIVHGWLGNQNSDINPVVRHACLNRDDVNVIFVDWRRLASSNYITATNGVPAVGRALGQFLAFVNLINGVPFSQMHLVGFCLGAHIVGYAGRELEGRIVRITGLNPAGPLWNQNSGRLNPNDAIYVEAIHTNGVMTNLGDTLLLQLFAILLDMNAQTLAFTHGIGAFALNLTWATMIWEKGDLEGSV
ncbi:hypothetical protein PYW07_002816 [Mythimna separata]|uniref:Lipase domain-containing protein n=1 Tax=Mythimna separata TaxID=271217 RepID=A0AAD8DPI1_MYTSE|nr:hypothetical protein PYW07_002816 [Mythimna separata]